MDEEEGFKLTPKKGGAKAEVNGDVVEAMDEEEEDDDEDDEEDDEDDDDFSDDDVEETTVLCSLTAGRVSL